MSRIDCPPVGNWQALLEGDRSEYEMEGLAHHLETCCDCRHTLESLAVAPAVWEDSARALGEQRWKASREPALRDVVERLKDEDLSTPEVDLSFLQPADKPGLLGLLDRYEVQEEIGRGGMGVVLKAVDPDLNRVVAIKVMSPWLASNVTARRRFVREAKAAAAVCHDHIVTVHGVREADGLPYLVMQYVVGESLQNRLDREGPLAVEEVVRIGLQTATGLTAAHAQGLIHRDIKPANLLLEKGSARVKITDFGLARMADEVALTQDGVIAGTPEYMAPEQARGETVDHRADLFSLGSVLYACCTGSPPFRGSTALAVLRQVSEEEPAPLRSLNLDVPVWLETFIARLMAKEPAERFQSAAEATALLEDYLGHLRQPATVAAPELPPLRGGDRPRSPGCRSRYGSARSVRRSLGLAALVLVAALGVAAVAWFAGGGPFIAASEGYEQSFRGGPDGPLDWERFGPDADEKVQFEPNGLRITLPPGSPKSTGTGLRSTFGVKGDFEITVTFEILQESAPAVLNKKTRFTLAVLLDRPGFNMATIARAIRQQRESNAPPKPRGEFQMWEILGNESTGNNKERFNSFPTEAKTGRLRLVRSGSTLSFHAAEGRDGDFVLLQKYPFGDEDVKDIRLVGATDDNRHGSLDVRVSDLRIRATNLLSDSAPASKPQRQSGSKKWLAALGIMGLLALSTLVVCLVVRRHRRRGNAHSPNPVLEGEVQAKPAAPPISFQCPGCEKTLKVKAVLVGKKVKCPQCGMALVVPAADTYRAEKPEPRP